MSNLRHEKLVDAYEKALFALVLEEVAEDEGEQLIKLNATLQADPDAEVPEQLKQRCSKIIQAEAAKEKVHRAARYSRKAFRTVAVAVFICVTLFTTVFAVSSDFRRHTLNAVIDVFDEYSVITIQKGHADKEMLEQTGEHVIANHYNIGLTWMPDGYELTEGWSNGVGDFAEYMSAEKNGFNVFVVPMNENSMMQVDTEDCEQVEVTVQEHSATLLRKSTGRLTVIWIDEDTQVFYQVLGHGLPEEDLLKIADGLVWTGTIR